MFGFSYIKIIAVLALSAMLFYAGWSVQGWRLNAKYDAREVVLQDGYSKSLAAYAKKLSDQEFEAREAAAELQGKQASLNTTITKLKEQAKHAHYTAKPSVAQDCSHPFTVQLPVDLNRLSAVADGADVPPATATPSGTGGTASTTGATSAVDGGTLVDWYADVARAYGQCKAQLDAIRKWDAKFWGSDSPLTSPLELTQPPVDWEVVDRIWAYVKVRTGAPIGLKLPHIVLDWGVPLYARMGTTWPREGDNPVLPLQISVAPRTLDIEGKRDPELILWGLGHELLHYAFILRENNWDPHREYYVVVQKHHCNVEFLEAEDGVADLLWNIWHDGTIRGKAHAEAARSCRDYPQQ